MTTMLAVLGLGGWEVILILAVVLILFGAKKLPELAKGLGKGIKEFKNATKDVTEEMNRAMEPDHYTPPPSRQIEPPAEKPATPAAHSEPAVPHTTPQSK